MALDAFLLEILVCPEDKGPLWYFEDEASLYNPRLRRRYAIRDGIPVLLVDEAETVDEEEHARLEARSAEAVTTGTGGAATPADAPSQGPDPALAPETTEP
ncbi:MAG TPA: Trm112 family protein [Acidimicrobiales bacterium]|nr:Trm112 family protein [Acidimicrobiales bacterium]